MRSAEEAFLYLTKLKQILIYLGICDGNMEEGSLRCDANISIREKGTDTLGTKTEVKNMNSFHNVENAINKEIERQRELLEEGDRVIQQTLLWNADSGEVIPMRSKEEAHDYRYFPDPDLVPVLISAGWKEEIEASLPELPDKKHERFVSEYGISEYDAGVLTQYRDIADYFEQVVKTTKDYKSAANWVMVEVLKILNEEKIPIDRFIISAENLGAMINLIGEGTISSKIAKEVFAQMLIDNKAPGIIIKEKNLVQISDSGAIAEIIDRVLAENDAQVNMYLSGKEKILGFFVGQIMKETKGKANPQLVNSLLKEKLEAKRNN
jgi:aspartyl-tRNA(Asn)/glutamyl-tRNA(Gln) amidotransferase subunit B